jgi:regulatory protein
VEPASDSSSPRDKRPDAPANEQPDELEISAIEKKVTRRGHVRVVLSDGSSFEILRDVYRDSALDRGDRLTYSDAEELRLRSEAVGAERKALALLARSQHTRWGLRQKLLQRGFSEAIIDRTLQRMDELAYIDDDSFAKNWLSARMARHPEGRYALLAGLLKKGIARETAEKLLRDEVSAEAELVLARRAYEKIISSGSLTAQQASRRLSNRGFSASAIRKFLNETAIDSCGGEETQSRKEDE